MWFILGGCLVVSAMAWGVIIGSRRQEIPKITLPFPIEGWKRCEHCQGFFGKQGEPADFVQPEFCSTDCREAYELERMIAL